MKNFFFFLAFVLFIVSCSKEETIPASSWIPEKGMQRFKNNGDQISIYYDSLLHDSRCPRRAMCVWQGEASVALRIQVNNDIRPFHLSTMDWNELHNDTTLLGYHIKLNDVIPYPGDAGSVRKIRVEVREE
jgi:hypothetical protein